MELKLLREYKSGVLRTTVVYIDQFGNIMTWYKGSPFELNTKVIINGKVEGRVVRTFSEVRPGEVAVYVNSFGYLEIAIFEGSAAKELDVKVGDIVELKEG